MTAPDAPRDVPAEGPATEAGRAMDEEWYPGGGDGLDVAEHAEFTQGILAIEQQARQAALDDVRRETRHWPLGDQRNMDAILDRLNEPQP